MQFGLLAEFIYAFANGGDFTLYIGYTFYILSTAFFEELVGGSDILTFPDGILNFGFDFSDCNIQLYIFIRALFDQFLELVISLD